MTKIPDTNGVDNTRSSSRESARTLLRACGKNGYRAEPDSPGLQVTQDLALALLGDGGLVGEVNSYVTASGAFALKGGEGTISGSKFTFRTVFCAGSLTAQTGNWIYSGWVMCQTRVGYIGAPMHVQIR